MVRQAAAALVFLMSIVQTPALLANDDLADGFANPPDAAKPWAYWWWLDSYATKEGITKDLEEMKRQGIAGVLLFDAGEGGPDAPKGPVFMSPAWRELYKHALREADRLGIDVGVNLCSGWNAGGAWVTPEHAAKELVWTATQVQGPGPIEKQLPKPLVRENYYRDASVLAFPASGPLPGAPAKVTASSSYRHYTPDLALDGNSETRWVSNSDKPGQGPTPQRPEWLSFEFPQPLPAASLYLEPYSECGPKECELECSQDGKAFQKLASFTVEPGRAKTVPFAEMPARFFRLLLKSSHPFQGPQSWNVQIAEIAILKKGQRPPMMGPLKHWDLKAARTFLSGLPDMLHEEDSEKPGERDCESRQVIDLSGKMDSSGRLSWTVPQGAWTVLRLGCTLLGAKTKCVSPGAIGYEIDFFSAEAMDLHFAETGQKMIADAGPLAGKTLKYFHDDSYEVAGPNGLQPTWTPRLRAEFQKRRGYDPLPYLPVLARRIVDSREISNRFLWDYRRTIGDLIAANHYRRMRELAQRHGIGTHPESAGPFWHHIDALEIEGINDIPMGEFWKRVPEQPNGAVAFVNWYPTCDTIRQIASAAHLYGKRLCQAEAFTSMGPNWEEDFFDLKDIGDRAFCAGLTRNVLCFYVHQGRLDVKPGFQWEAAGTHFDRNVTWWNQIHAWLKYLARCQHLLQQGRFVADLCYYYGEDVPNFVPGKVYMRPPLPKGYDCDTINADVLLNRLSVKDGRLFLPDGMSYRLLVLPERRPMSPRVLRKIKELVEAGATVLGPKPDRSPGLTGYPVCDRQVKQLADAIWGEVDGQKVRQRKVGLGRIFSGRTPQDVLAADGISPDFEYRSPAPDANLDFIHRTHDGAQIYFVSNQQNRPEKAECTFRVSGKQPELWDAVTGERRDATDFREQAGRTIVPMAFAPRQSWFFVFRRAVETGKSPQPNCLVFGTPVELTGPWTVHFDPSWGGPASIVFEKLDDWTKRSEAGIKYYSGKATYRKTFDLGESLRRPGKRLYLDLGKVKNVAEVRLNGKDLGVVWTAPWHVEITGAVQPAGNKLEIDIVNLWPNRLIGDAALPPQQRLTVTNVKKFHKDFPLYESGLLGPVTLKGAE